MEGVNYLFNTDSFIIKGVTNVTAPNLFNCCKLYLNSAGMMVQDNNYLSQQCAPCCLYNNYPQPYPFTSVSVY